MTLPTAALVAAVLATVCASANAASSSSNSRTVDVYVSYAYNEKDDIQRDNLAFFWTVGAGAPPNTLCGPSPCF